MTLSSDEVVIADDMDRAERHEAISILTCVLVLQGLLIKDGHCCGIDICECNTKRPTRIVAPGLVFRVRKQTKNVSATNRSGLPSFTLLRLRMLSIGIYFDKREECDNISNNNNDCEIPRSHAHDT